MGYKCIGCDRDIHWDGTGLLFSYTCQCGCTVFYHDEQMNVAVPVSLVSAIKDMGTDVPHIDYYVGWSSHTSGVKDAFIQELLQLGFTWMKDCKQCLENGTYQRHLVRREQRLAVREAENLVRGKDNYEIT